MVFVFVPIMTIVCRILNKKMRSAFIDQRHQIGELNAKIEDSLLGQKVVKAFTNEDIEDVYKRQECELMKTADDFVGDYCRLLEEARKQDCRTLDALTRKTLETTEQYRDFKDVYKRQVV